ncbi:hypothetical protein FRC17_011110 [Serendipita sp. 399]|nr:hypothetical protein FRC17_011110 [Serendipita sp. 399]
MKFDQETIYGDKYDMMLSGCRLSKGLIVYSKLLGDKRLENMCWRDWGRRQVQSRTSSLDTSFKAATAVPHHQEERQIQENASADDDAEPLSLSATLLRQNEKAAHRSKSISALIEQSSEIATKNPTSPKSRNKLPGLTIHAIGLSIEIVLAYAKEVDNEVKVEDSQDEPMEDIVSGPIDDTSPSVSMVISSCEDASSERANSTNSLAAGDDVAHIPQSDDQWDEDWNTSHASAPVMKPMTVHGEEWSLIYHNTPWRQLQRAQDMPILHAATSSSLPPLSALPNDRLLLNERTQRHALEMEYTFESTGPEHDRRWIATISVSGQRIATSSLQRTKAEAKEVAAGIALRYLDQFQML